MATTARASRNTTAGREVAVRKTTAVARGADNPFTAAAAALGSDGGSYAFGKFNGNNGDWTYGSNPAKEIEPGSRILIDMNQGVRRGWICWKAGEVKDERMVLVSQGNPPSEDQLTDHGPYEKKDDGWKEQVSVRFRLLDNGDEVELKMTSRAGVRGVGALCRGYGAQFRDYDADSLIVVEIDSKEYTPKDKSFGRKYAPVFEIVEFISPDQAAELLGDVDAGEEEGTSEEAPWAGDKAPVTVEDEGEIPVQDDDEGDDVQDAPPVQRTAPSVSVRPQGRRSKRA